MIHEMHGEPRPQPSRALMVICSLLPYRIACAVLYAAGYVRGVRIARQRRRNV